MRRLDRTTRWLLVIAMFGLAVRVVYIAGAKRGPCRIVVSGEVIGEYHSQCTGLAGQANDQTYYNATANWLARGHLFTDPLKPGHPEAADHPPLTAIVLAPVSFVFDHVPLLWLADRTHLPHHRTTQTHVREHRYTMALLGAFVVLLIGLLARRIAGDRAAIIAAIIAAGYPNLWVNDGLIFSETVANVVVLLLLFAALRAWREQSLCSVALVGALGGLAALARAELGLLVVLVAVPLALTRRGRRAAALALAIGCAAAVLAPWVVYNNVRFHDRTFVSTNDGLAMGASNCDEAYHGGALGLTVLHPPCTFTPEEEASIGDQSQVAAAYRKRAFTYIRHHESRVPVVVAARIARTWSFWDPRPMVTFNEGENRERPVSWAGLYAYYPLLAAAIAGGVVLWRRGRRDAVWMLVAPAIAVTVGVALTYGQVRFRAAAEPSLVVLGGVALGVLGDAWKTRRVRRSATAPRAAVTT